MPLGSGGKDLEEECKHLLQVLRGIMGLLEPVGHLVPNGSRPSGT